MSETLERKFRDDGSTIYMDWRVACIVHHARIVHKGKGNKYECSNSRGIC